MTRDIRPVGIALAFLFTLAVLASEAEAALTRSTPVESALEARGHILSRTPGSVIPTLRQSEPDLILILSPAPLPRADRNALDAYVASGGKVWIVGPDPDRALPSRLEGTLATYVGTVYDADGGPPALALPDRTGTSSPALLALNLTRAAFAAAYLTDDRAFRDTNENGRLDLGEAGGPFVVAATNTTGKGQYFVLATVRPDADAALIADIIPAGSHTVLVLDGAAPYAPALPIRAALAIIGTASADLVSASVVLLAATSAVLLLIGRRAQAPPEESPARAALAAYRARTAIRHAAPDETTTGAPRR